MNIVNLVKAVKDLESSFAELGLGAPTIVLRSRGDFGGLVFELAEQGDRNKNKQKIILKHWAICEDAQEMRIGEITIRPPTDDEDPPGPRVDLLPTKTTARIEHIAEHIGRRKALAEKEAVTK